ncbi:MAG: flavodoxin family protein [Methanothrix sp.]|nr:flavodoxin family protein [Methanothrix sp.]
MRSTRVLALNGSPRRGGNTDLLLDEILRGARSRGHSAEKIRLYEREILPCIDCRRCKQERSGYACAQVDAMREVYPLMEGADVLVFGTPVYWYAPSAKMKLLLDRLRPFIASRGLQGRRGVVVAPSEEGPGCCGPLMEIFQRSFEYLGMVSGGALLVRAYERGEVRGSPSDMRAAYDLGASL